MNPLLEDAVYLLVDLGWHEIVPIVMIAALRPLGMMYGFTGFAWTMGNARLVRITTAISVGLPVALINLPKIEAFVKDAQIYSLVLISVVEIGIGFGIGLMASLPFFAMQYAGAVTDQFRGESDSGLHSPSGGTITTFGALYMIIALAAFAYSDGLALLIQALYESNLIWPLDTLVPEITLKSLLMLIGLFTDSLILAIQVTLPLLIILSVVEFSVSIGARVSKRFNFYNMAFPIKNLVTIALLLLVPIYILTFLENGLVNRLTDFEILERFPDE